MSKKIKPITTDEWIAATFTAANGKPDNAITIEDVCKKTGLSISQSLNRMNELEKKGKVKKGKFVEGGKIRNYYIPIE